MIPATNPHITTDEEIRQIKNLGFEITSGTKSLKDFINDSFPGLQLFQFLTEIDDLLSPLTTGETILKAEINSRKTYYTESQELFA